MARLLSDTCTLAAEILDGKHDADLQNIAHACTARTKRMFRKGQKVRLVGTRNPALEGQIGVIEKVNTKTVTVGVGEPTTDQWGTTYAVGSFNCSPGLLEAIA